MVEDLPNWIYEELGRQLPEDEFDVFVALVDAIFEEEKRIASGLPRRTFAEVLDAYGARRQWPAGRAHEVYDRLRVHRATRRLGLPPLHEESP